MNANEREWNTDLLNSDLNNLAALPIPAFLSPRTADMPLLAECGEPLVLVSETLQFVFCAPEYYRQGVAHALPTCYVRADVRRRLAQAAARLGSGERSLIVWDAWRPIRVQQALYDSYQTQLRQTYPDISPDALEARTREFIALPSRDPLRPSPHLTGGAVDVTLGDVVGRSLAMGTAYDDFTERAATRRFEEAAPTLMPEEQTYRANRRILYHVMAQAGFTNYEAEWWHFDYGNRLWARQTNRAPIYGPIEP